MWGMGGLSERQNTQERPVNHTSNGLMHVTLYLHVLQVRSPHALDLNILHIHTLLKLISIS